MDRLTWRLPDGNAGIIENGGVPNVAEAIERLAQYEETGLTPEEIGERNSVLREEKCWEKKYAELHYAFDDLKCHHEYLEIQCKEAREENAFLRGVMQTVEVIFGRTFNERK